MDLESNLINTESGSDIKKINKFNSMPTFLELLVQSIGPLMYNVGNSLHDAVDLILISKALGNECLQIVGFSSIVRFLIRCFGVYFSNGAVAEVTKLIGAKMNKEAEQVVSDLFRLSIIVMTIISVIFLFVSKYLLVLMGCTNDIADKSFQYLLPIIICGPFTGIFQLGCGLLQCEGRSILNGLMQLFGFLLNCGLFAPLLLFYFNVSIKLSGLSYALSQVIPAIVLFCLIYKGCFDLKPKIGAWKNKISPETYKALKLSAPFILNILAGTISPILLLNYCMKAANAINVPGEVASGFSVFLKVQTFVNSFSLGINQGLLSTGCYSYGTGNAKKILKLFMYSLFLSLLILLGFTLFVYFENEAILKIWIDKKESKMMLYASKIMKIPFYTNFMNSINDAMSNLILCISNSLLPIIPSIVRGLICIVSSIMLYYSGKKNPVRMMYTFCLSDCFVFISDLIIVYKPLRSLYRQVYI